VTTPVKVPLSAASNSAENEWCAIAGIVDSSKQLKAAAVSVLIAIVFIVVSVSGADALNEWRDCL
jgi:hypothetical protein